MAEIQWPKADRVERRDDMSSTGKLTVMLQRDGDVVVNVSKGETVKEWESATVEFCAGGGGGGRSMRTREALVALMVAIEADNAERPIHDAPGVQECFPLLDPNVPEGGSRYPDKGCYRVGCPVHGGPGGFPDGVAMPLKESDRG